MVDELNTGTQSMRHIEDFQAVQWACMIMVVMARAVHSHCIINYHPGLRQVLSDSACTVGWVI